MKKILYLYGGMDPTAVISERAIEIWVKKVGFREEFYTRSRNNSAWSKFKENNSLSGVPMKESFLDKFFYDLAEGKELPVIKIRNGFITMSDTKGMFEWWNSENDSWELKYFKYDLEYKSYLY